MTRQRVENITYVAVILLLAALFGAMNLFTTPKGDDIKYSYVSGTLYEPFVSLLDLWRSKVAHYVEFNGRLSDTVAQIFLGYLGRTAFVICNALMSIALIVSIQRLTAPKEKRLAATVVIAAVLLLFAPVPGETMLWLCGACNYLWPTVLCLTLVSWLSSRTADNVGVSVTAAVALSALVVANFNEAIALPTVAGAICFLVCNRCHITGLRVVAVVVAVVGVAVIFMSPGTLSRADVELSSGEMSTLAIVLHHLKQLVRYGVRYHVMPGLAAVTLLVIAARQSWRVVTGNLWAWIWLMCALMLAILGNDHNERPYFYWSVVSIVIVVKALMSFLAERRRLTRAVVLCALVAVVVMGSHGMSVILRYKHYNDAVERAIIGAPDVAVLPASDFPSNRWAALSYYDSERYNGYGDVYCAYYHKSLIAFLRPPLMEHWKQHASLREGGEAVDYDSSLPNVLDSVYYFAGKSFTLIPCEPSAVVLDEPMLTFHVSHPEWRDEHRERYPYQGLYRHVNTVCFYSLTDRNGTYYLVVPPADPDVTRYEIPVVANGKHCVVTLDRRSAL